METWKGYGVGGQSKRGCWLCVGDGESPSVSDRGGPRLGAPITLIIVYRVRFKKGPGVGAKKGRVEGAQVGEVVG